MSDHIANLWRHVHDKLRAFIAARVGGGSETDDILQEVFVRVHRSLGQLREPERLVSWVFQITRTVIADYYRAPTRRELPVGLAEELDTQPTFHDGDTARPEDVAAETELSGCLRPMIEQLAPEYREALLLVDLEGVTQRDAAERLGLSVPGMKSRVQRGRRQLRQLLDECCLIELDGRKGVLDFEHRNPDQPRC
ncbi:RNA polymerase sigma factor SigZ [Nitrospira sp.]|nr:RNA polymerase sigma factor SigZ [Nitrospira sp.]